MGELQYYLYPIQFHKFDLCDKAIWIENGNIKSIGEVNSVCDQYLKDAEKASAQQLANIKFR